MDRMTLGHMRDRQQPTSNKGRGGCCPAIQITQRNSGCRSDSSAQGQYTPPRSTTGIKAATPVGPHSPRHRHNSIRQASGPEGGSHAINSGMEIISSYSSANFRPFLLLATPVNEVSGVTACCSALLDWLPRSSGIEAQLASDCIKFPKS
jgi:hypothetical protein